MQNFKSSISGNLERLNKTITTYMFIEAIDNKERKYFMPKNKISELLLEYIKSAFKEENFRKTKALTINAIDRNPLNTSLKIKQIDSSQNQSKSNIGVLNRSIEVYLATADIKNDKTIKGVDTILNLLSPFENSNTNTNSLFLKLYPKDKKWKVTYNNFLTHNGGYQILAYLYSAG